MSEFLNPVTADEPSLSLTRGPPVLAVVVVEHPLLSSSQLRPCFWSSKLHFWILIPLPVPRFWFSHFLFLLELSSVACKLFPYFSNKASSLSSLLQAATSFFISQKMSRISSFILLTLISSGLGGGPLKKKKDWVYWRKNTESPWYLRDPGHSQVFDYNTDQSDHKIKSLSNSCYS